MKKILGVAMGNCVHIAGVYNFLAIAEREGYQTIFLGPAVPIDEIIAAIKKHEPDIVAMSYRLTPEVAGNLFEELKIRIENNQSLCAKEYIFGGTPQTAEVARKSGIFKITFGGDEPIHRIVGYLRGESVERSDVVHPDTLAARISAKYPYPLLRHHFGLPNLEETIAGAKELSESQVLDILSVAPDQNAQEFFFNPEKMDRSKDGAGGVPLRKDEDLRRLFDATRYGNHPLVRCYSGTQDLVKWAEMLLDINNAWGAVPLCWYSELDGRSKRPLAEAIRENQSTIKWYADHGIPVEITDSHQWALRNSGDVIEVASAYIAAKNAKSLGVKHYVQQYMLNTPPGTNASMDIAKMLAKATFVENLQDTSFQCYRMIRTGLQLLSTNSDVAKGQLAASLQVGMALKPHIVHVVGHSEGDHAALPNEIVESCRIAEGVIRYSMLSPLPIERDPDVQARKNELLTAVDILLASIKELGNGSPGEPLCNPEVIEKAVSVGLLDAPQLRGTVAAGRIKTAMVNGTCRSVHPQTGRVLRERERIDMLRLMTGDIKREMMDQ